MEEEKRVAILVTIALVLAVTAITLNLMDSTSDVPTQKPMIQEKSEGGEVGVQIQPPQVEDKLAESTETSGQ